MKPRNRIEKLRVWLSVKLFDLARKIYPKRLDEELDQEIDDLLFSHLT